MVPRTDPLRAFGQPTRWLSIIDQNMEDERLRILLIEHDEACARMLADAHPGARHGG
jgi:hypothetical protein